MKKVYILALVALTGVLPSLVYSQEINEERSDDKVVIVKKTRNEDGTVHVEKIVTDRENAVQVIEEAELGENITLSSGQTGESAPSVREEQMRVEVTVKDDTKSIWIHGAEGSEHIQLDAGEAMDDEKVRELREKGVFIEDSGAGDIKIVRVKENSADEETFVITTREDGTGTSTDGTVNVDEEVEVTVYVDKGHMKDKAEAFMRGEVLGRAMASLAKSVNCVALGVFVNSGKHGAVKVQSIIDGSGAQDAGMQSGDVISSIGGNVIESYDDLHNVLGQYEPGQSVDVEYKRDDQTVSVSAELRAWGELPGYEDSWRAGIVCGQEEEFMEQRARKLMALKKENCVALGVFLNSSHNAPLHVSRIIEGSGAEDAGIQSGDRITAIDGEQLRTYADLHLALGRYEPGDVVEVEYDRDGEQFTVQTELRGWGELPGYENTPKAGIDCGDPNYKGSYNFLTLPEEEVTRSVTIIKKNAATEDPDPVEEAIPLESEALFDNTLDLPGFLAFPNPTGGRFTVQFEAEAKPTVVSIFDTNGRELFRDNQQNFDGIYNREVDLSGQARGALILSVKQGDKRFTEQIVIQ